MHSHHSLVEGDSLSEKIEKISFVTKIVAIPGGGSILKSTSTYHTTGDHEIEEEHVRAGNEMTYGVLKVIVEHLETF